MLEQLEAVDWKAVRQAFGDGTHLVRHYDKVDAAATARVPHDLVRAALAAAPLWTVQSDLLACYGLPTTCAALAAWLEKETR